MRRFVILVALAGALAVVTSTTTASAGSSPIVNDTFVSKTLSGVDPDVNPCTGSPAINYSVGRATFHIVAFEDGTVHVVLAIHSDFLVDTIDPAGVDFSGHETDTLSLDGTNGAATTTVTFTPVLTGTDGTRIVGHETGHFTANANGDVTVSFDSFRVIRGCS